MYNSLTRSESRVTNWILFAWDFLSFSTESPTSVELLVMGWLVPVLV